MTNVNDQSRAREARFAAIKRAIDKTPPSVMAGYLAETIEWDLGTADPDFGVSSTQPLVHRRQRRWRHR